MIRHHPSDELLLRHAAGSLGGPTAVAVETHLASCPRCRAEVAGYAALGGALLAETKPAELSADALARTMARIERPASPAEAEPRLDEETRRVLPPPLRRRVRANLRDLRWRRLGKGVRVADIDLGPGRGTERGLLMRIPAGTKTTAHTHGAGEITLVLAGGFHDAGEAFGPGDFDMADDSRVHAPQADGDGDCLCLVVLDGPVRFTGPFARFLTPFVRL